MRRAGEELRRGILRTSRVFQLPAPLRLPASLPACVARHAVWPASPTTLSASLCSDSASDGLFSWPLLCCWFQSTCAPSVVRLPVHRLSPLRWVRWVCRPRRWQMISPRLPCPSRVSESPSSSLCRTGKPRSAVTPHTERPMLLPVPPRPCEHSSLCFSIRCRCRRRCSVADRCGAVRRLSDREGTGRARA